MLVETKQYKGYSIKIYVDEDAADPVKEFYNLGTFVCFHRRYDLGNCKDFNEPEDFIEYAKQNALIFLPLYLFDHSGLSISTGSFAYCDPGEWDSGQVGWIFVDRKKVFKEYGWKKITKERRKKIENFLESEVEQYDHYLNGNVYGYNIEKDGEDIDSYWGFYGNYDESGLLDYAKEAIDDHIIKERRKHQDRLKSLIKSNVPLIYREARV